MIRQWTAKRVTEQSLKSYLSAPLVDKRQAWHEAAWLVVDIETTGLNPATDEIVSLGWVAIDAGKVVMSSAQHHHVKIQKQVGQSAVFHQVSDDQLASGMGIRKAMNLLLKHATGKTLVFHHASLDMAFLNNVCRRLYRARFLSLVCDTMQWEKRKVMTKYHHIPGDSLRLYHARKRYNLPDYPAHDALTDALATAELFIAQIHHFNERATVADILGKSRVY